MTTGHVKLSRMAAVLCAAVLLLSGTVQANEIAPSTRAMLQDLKPLTDDLARYRYLMAVMRKLPKDEQLVAMQFLATTESELGLYARALRDFPIDSRKNFTDPLPSPAQWRAIDAAPAIAQLAAGRRLVVINEAHHDPHTRELTLALLPRLRAAGFTHFAMEALGDKDTALSARGYPVWTSGSEYLHEPLLGEIARKALQLGFVLVPYEVDSTTTEGRESGQAENLYKRVFAGHPEARLFVHAGYAHIDKVRGRLGSAIPMAATLARLSGIEPLSIEQTQFREANPTVPHASYDQLIDSFRINAPSVLERIAPAAAGTTAPLWSADPSLHDVSVILPPDRNSPKNANIMPTWQEQGDLFIPVMPSTDEGLRPDWLGLNGQRQPFAVNSDLCERIYPCVVEAIYAKESDQAVAADRFAFLRSGVRSALYLFPDEYRLRVRDADGKVLSERAVTISKQGK